METKQGDKALRAIASKYGMAISEVARTALRLGLPDVEAELARRGEQPVLAATAPAASKQGVRAVIPAKPSGSKAVKAVPAKRPGRPRKSVGGIPQAQFQAPQAVSSAV